MRCKSSSHWQGAVCQFQLVVRRSSVHVRRAHGTFLKLCLKYIVSKMCLYGRAFSLSCFEYGIWTLTIFRKLRIFTSWTCKHRIWCFDFYDDVVVPQSVTNHPANKQLTHLTNSNKRLNSATNINTTFLSNSKSNLKFLTIDVKFSLTPARIQILNKTEFAYTNQL